jgi:hypothetical protein
MDDRRNSAIFRTQYIQPDPTGRTGVQNQALIQSGSVPAARLGLATDMSNNDTISIGGHTFIFKTTLVAATTSTQVKLGTSATATRNALLNAINGVADALVVPATTPFSKSVVADVVATTSVRVRLAAAQGGLPIAGVSPSIALAATTTPALNIWSSGNLNESGKSPGDSQSALVSFTVTATMVTNGSFDLELPFTPTVFMVQVLSSAGVLRSSNEAVTISGSALHFVMAGAGSPNLQATDVVTVLAVQ